MGKAESDKARTGGERKCQHVGRGKKRKIIISKREYVGVVAVVGV